MRLKHLIAAALLAVPAWACSEQPPPLVNPVGADAPAPADVAAVGELTIDQILDKLDQRGQNLEAFDARVEMTETEVALQLGSTRAGRVWFQRTDAQGGGRLRVNFEKKLTGDTLADDRKEYLLADGWLTDRDYVKRIEVRRQVLRPGEKMNLLKLGEGPFPLPIGQKKEEVKRHFDVRKIAPAKGDPAGSIHLVLKTKPDSSFAGKFKAIDVWIDPKTDMPVRIDTIDPKENDQKSTVLKNVRINPQIGDADFKLEKIDEGNWKSHEEPFRQ